MASKLSEEYPVGVVVWFKASVWPWWPSKVIVPDLESEEAIAVRCFVTEDEYLLEDTAASRKKLKPFVHEDVEQFVTKEKKSCYKKTSVYKDYCEALNQAVEYTKEQKGDPDFSLGVDPFADVSTLSLKKAPPVTPKSVTIKKSSSTIKRTVSSGNKYPRVRSASPTSKRGRRSHDVAAGAALAEVPEDRSKGSERKRNRDTSVDLSDCVSPFESESKKQRMCRTPSPSRGKGKERGEEPVPKKLCFNDDVEGMSPSETISESLISPVDRADEKPSLACDESLTNGHAGSPCDNKDTVVNGVDTGESGTCTGESVKPTANGEDRLKGEKEKVGEERGEDELKGEKEEVREERDSLADEPPRFGGRSDDDLSAEDKETEELSDSDDDDSMPAFSCDVKEDLTVRQLKKNSIIWVQYNKKFPYWPALVVDVKRSGKSVTGRVFFFGYNEKMTTPVRDKKKIAPFASKRSEQFLEEGMKSVYRIQFEQAVEEARTCMDLRVNPDESISTPRKLFDKVANLRPKEYKKERYECPMQSAVEAGGAVGEEEDEEEAKEREPEKDDFLTGKNRLPFYEDSDDEIREAPSDTEEDDPVYGYGRVMAELEELRPVLTDITQGKVESEFHKKMLESTRKEHNQQKVAPKAGPLIKWSGNKLTDLVTELNEIGEEASCGKYHLSYAFSVLLPEFVIRVMMKFEGISEADAVEKLDYHRD